MRSTFARPSWLLLAFGAASLLSACQSPENEVLGLGQGGAGGSSPSTTGPSSSGSGTSSGAGGNCASCGPNSRCDEATMTCACVPGFVGSAGTCVATPPGEPSTHTQQEVCDRWKSGHVVTEPDPLVTSGAECDAGKLKPGAFVDTLNRLNMFRWMAGLAPVVDDAALDTESQLCANLEAFWPFLGGSPHAPPADSKCYTPEGGATAGKSNLAWGSGSPAQAIDQYMEDAGNETTLGHRRWVLNPPLGPVGIGYWKGGGKYGDAQCLEVFGMAGGAGLTPPTWNSLPTAGFAPITTTKWIWSFEGSFAGIPDATITMVRVSDNAPLAVNIQKLSQGYGENCISWTPNGWAPEVGTTYRVTVSGLAEGNIVYEVTPVDCP